MTYLLSTCVVLRAHLHGDCGTIEKTLANKSQCVMIGPAYRCIPPSIRSSVSVVDLPASKSNKSADKRRRCEFGRCLGVSSVFARTTTTTTRNRQVASPVRPTGTSRSVAIFSYNRELRHTKVSWRQMMHTKSLSLKSTPYEPLVLHGRRARRAVCLL